LLVLLQHLGEKAKVFQEVVFVLGLAEDLHDADDPVVASIDQVVELGTIYEVNHATHYILAEDFVRVAADLVDASGSDRVFRLSDGVSTFVTDLQVLRLVVVWHLGRRFHVGTRHGCIQLDESEAATASTASTSVGRFWLGFSLLHGGRRHELASDFP